MTHGGAGPNILLCEDERIVALAEKAMLEAAGYTVHIAGSGEQALLKLADAQQAHGQEPAGTLPALILMDIDLGPGMDGTQAAEQIVASYEIPVVFLSSHTEPEIVEKTEGITSYGYVVKHSGETVLLASIRMAFRLFEARQRQERAEEQLREQNRYLELYRTAVDGMTDHKIAVVDSRYRYRVASRQFANSYRKQESEIVGGTIADLTGVEVFETKIRPHIDRGLAGVPTEFENWFTFPGLGRRHMRVRYYPLPGFDLGERAVAVVIQDTTEHTRAEQSAQTAERNLALILDSVPAAIWFTDCEGRYVRVNRAWSDAVGVEPDDAIGKTSADVFDSDMAQQLDVEEQEIVRTGTPLLGHVTEYRTLSGETGWSRTDRLPTTDESGNIIGVVGFAVDITAERTAIRETEDARVRSSAILAAHPDIVFVTDRDGLILEYHTKATDLLASTDLVGRSAADELPEETGARILHAIRQAYDTGQLQVVDYELDVPAGHRHFEDRLVRLDDGRVLGIVRDITVRRHAELEAERLLAEKENLLREVQHRIKNTMNTMGAMLSLHADAVQDSPAAKAALTDARSRFRSMEVLYDQLYRSESHDRGSLKQYLSQVVHTVVALFPAGPRVAVSEQLDDLVLPTSVLSPIGMIVTELVTNSMKYAFADDTLEAGDEARLTVASRVSGTRVCITVADNGPGFQPEAAGNTIDGFGLRMIRALTEQLGGTVEITTDAGTAVSVAFSAPAE
ncbi:MAG: PAS domain S-box protein [Spirochaetaceae bacterium]|nr:MAG: PAS domain S-box protein [Spirochaetaceae bacterium]